MRELGWKSNTLSARQPPNNGIPNSNVSTHRTSSLLPPVRLPQRTGAAKRGEKKTHPRRPFIPVRCLCTRETDRKKNNINNYDGDNNNILYERKFGHEYKQVGLVGQLLPCVRRSGGVPLPPRVTICGRKDESFNTRGKTATERYYRLSMGLRFGERLRRTGSRELRWCYDNRYHFIIISTSPDQRRSMRDKSRVI